MKTVCYFTFYRQQEPGEKDRTRQEKNTLKNN